MTKTQDELIIIHLAEKVCGWKKETRGHGIDTPITPIWRRPNGSWCHENEFNPIGSITDCGMVMDAWRNIADGILEISITKDLVAVEARCGSALGYVTASEFTKAVSYAIWMCSLGRIKNDNDQI